MRLPKPITLWVGRKLADKSKDEIILQVCIDLSLPLPIFSEGVGGGSQSHPGRL